MCIPSPEEETEGEGRSGSGGGSGGGSVPAHNKMEFLGAIQDLLEAIRHAMMEG